MPIVEELPEAVTEALTKEYGTADGYRVATSSDIAGDGDFGERWLVMTEGDLVVLSPNRDGFKVSRRIPLERITGAETEPLIGTGVLEVQVDGHPTEVIQFSNSLMAKFNAVAKRIDSIAKKEEPPPADAEDEKKRCDRCGWLLDNMSEVCPRCGSRRKTAARLLTYALPHKRVLLGVMLITLTTTALAMIQPYFMKLFVDDVLVPTAGGADAEQQLRLLGLLVGALVLARVLGAGMGVLRGRMAALLGSNISFDIRSRLYESLQRLSLSYYDKRQVGAVMTRVTQDTNQLTQFLMEGLQHSAVSVLTVIGIAVVLFCMNWKLALLVMLPAPFLVLVTMFFWRRVRGMLHHFWHSMSRLGALLNDALSGIRVVKAFGQEEIEIEKFRDRNYTLYNAALRTDQTFALILPTLGLVMVAGSLLVWWFGGRDVILGRTTLGTLMAFIAYIAMFYGPLQMLTRITEWMSRSLTSAERIFEVMDTIPDIKDAPEAVAMPCIRGDIEFKNVTFGYDKHKPVLTKVNFSVKAGEMIGLVGHSGAGKSTTINLICRLYDVNEGAISVDGVDMRNIKLDDLRQQIGVVLQDPFLFNGTIAENIAYGKPDATREEIMTAARVANAHEFIMKLPDGYDTIVQERGQRLSGGERQRISIARAILRNPRILILDEATSSVDTQTEKQLQEAIANLVKDRTTFAIAHRLSTLRNADRLFVIEKGKFVEFGTHEELLRKRGVYHKLVQLQREVSKIKAVDG